MKSRIQQEKIAKSVFAETIRNKFDTYKHIWELQDAKECIICARYYGHEQLANKMQNDLI